MDTKNQFINGWSASAYLLIFGALLSLNCASLKAQDLDVPYVPTPQNVVEKMLDMANVQKGDYVIDLGSGDGRIVISAVKRGAYGHGIDLDPQRIKEARENAESQDVSDKVMFLQQNIFESDFSKASVITMYLLNSVNRKLRPQLLESLEPGTRIVSHSFNMGDWEPDKEETIESGNSMRAHTIYYWVIPAKVEGSWSWQVDGNNMQVELARQYQEIKQSGDSSWEMSEAVLSGKRISFKLSNGDIKHLYSGRVEGDSIEGMVQIYDGENHSVSTWSASHN